MYLEYASEGLSFRKVWTYLEVFLAVLHVSDPNSRTDLTLELKILILVWVAIVLALHMFLSWRKSTLALTIRALTSASVPPSLFTILPRYAKVSTSFSPLPQAWLGRCWQYLFPEAWSCLYVSSVPAVLKWFLALRSSLACVDVWGIAEQDNLQSLGHPIASTLSIGFRSFSESIAKRKRSCDSRHHCLTPVFTWKLSVKWIPCMTLHDTPS